MEDSFIRAYIDEVLVNIRGQVILQIVKPYTQLPLESIAKVSSDLSRLFEWYLILLNV